MTASEARFDDFFLKALPREGFTIEASGQGYVLRVDLEPDTSAGRDGRPLPAVLSEIPGIPPEPEGTQS